MEGKKKNVACNYSDARRFNELNYVGGIISIFRNEKKGTYFKE